MVVVVEVTELVVGAARHIGVIKSVLGSGRALCHSGRGGLQVGEVETKTFSFVGRFRRVVEDGWGNWLGWGEVAYVGDQFLGTLDGFDEWAEHFI